MNKLSGYQQYTLSDGRVVELKFCNATTELYAKSMGLKTMSEVEQSLTVPFVDGVDDEGMPVRKTEVTIAYLEALRMYVFAAAQYAAMKQGKDIDFNEWDAADWIEEIGDQEIFAAIDQPPASVQAAKKKKKAPLIRATQ